MSGITISPRILRTSSTGSSFFSPPYVCPSTVKNRQKLTFCTNNPILNAYRAHSFSQEPPLGINFHMHNNASLRALWFDFLKHSVTFRVDTKPIIIINPVPSKIKISPSASYSILITVTTTFSFGTFSYFHQQPASRANFVVDDISLQHSFVRSTNIGKNKETKERRQSKTKKNEATTIRPNQPPY